MLRGSLVIAGAAYLACACSSHGHSSGSSGTGGSGADASAATGGSAGSLRSSDAGLPVGDAGAVIGTPQCADPPAGARVWYVATDGNDAADGSSRATAFKTISKAAQSVGAGDFVMVAGGVYRERVRIDKGGSPSARVTFRPLDPSKEVVIDASSAVTGWTKMGGAVYSAHAGFDVAAVVVDDHPLLPQAASPTSAGHYYFDSAAQDVQVWTQGSEDPGTRTTGVIAADPGKTQQAIDVENASDVTLCGLTARFAGARGVLALADRVVVEYSKVVFNGGVGVRVAPYDTVQATSPEISHNEIAWNFLQNWPRCSNGFVSGGWGTGLSSLSDDTRIVGNVVHDNGGEGIVVEASNRGALIDANVVYDNFSANIYALNTQNVTITDNLSYSHTPDLSVIDPSLSDSDRQACQKRLRPDGILTGDEGGVSSFDHALIANNLVVDARHGLSHVNEGTGSGVKDVKFVFNTIVTPSAPLAWESVGGIVYGFNDGNNTGNVFQDNAVWVRSSAAHALDADTGTSSDPFSTIAISHNAFFTTGAKPFHWGPTYDDLFDHAGWLAIAGSAHGAGDVVGDPKFGSFSAFDPLSACPGAGSPLIDAALDVGVARDLFGHTRPVGSAPDIGVCEVGAK